jgi:hypothetical protein
LGGAIERGDIVVVGIWNPTRAGVDTDKGSAARGGATSLNEVVDEVVNGHNDSGVIDFGDRGCTVADMGDLLDESFCGEVEVVADGFGDQLRVERGDWKDGRGSINRVDFVAVATDEGVLFREFLECGGEGDPKDPAGLGDHGRVLRSQLLVRLRVYDGSGLDGDLFGKAAFGGSTRTVGELRLGATASCLHHGDLQRLPKLRQWHQCWGRGYIRG